MNTLKLQFLAASASLLLPITSEAADPSFQNSRAYSWPTRYPQPEAHQQHRKNDPTCDPNDHKRSPRDFRTGITDPGWPRPPFQHPTFRPPVGKQPSDDYHRNSP